MAVAISSTLMAKNSSSQKLEDEITILLDQLYTSWIAKVSRSKGFLFLKQIIRITLPYDISFSFLFYEEEKFSGNVVTSCIILIKMCFNAA